MARKSRIHFSGVLFHVMLRGNNGDDVFFSPEDRARFYFLMQYGVERFLLWLVLKQVHGAAA